MRVERGSSQAGLFDHLDRERALAEIRRPLDRVSKVVDSELLRPVLEEPLEYGRSLSPGRPAKNPVLMLKRCVL